MRPDWITDIVPNQKFLEPFKRNPSKLPGDKNWNPEALRWCSCRVFLVYGAARFRDTRFWDQGGVDPVPVRICNDLTRRAFSELHYVGIVDALAEAKGRGFKACLIDDLTPRDPFEVAEMFGGLIISKVHLQKVENTRATALRRLKLTRERATAWETAAGSPSGIATSVVSSL